MYRERLWPAPWVWALVVGVALMLGWALGFALGTGWGLAVVALSLGVMGAAMIVTVPTIEVRRDHIRAGDAVLPTSVISGVEVLDSESMGQAVREMSAPAYLVVRPWAARGGIRITLDDSHDPHHSWLVSSRQPARLCAHLLDVAPDAHHERLKHQEE